MGKDNDRGRALRADLEKALERDKSNDVLVALQGLEQLEPEEPRWPQKRGDYLLRRARKHDAESAYLRALDVLTRQGFLPRAVAMAKLIVELNPAQAPILDKISQDAARALRNKPLLTPGLRLPPSTLPSVGAVRIQPSTPAAGPAERLSFAPGAPIPEAVSSARPLARASDATIDEVRFDDLSEFDIVELDTSDMEAISIEPRRGVVALATPDPSAALISKLSATALFADVAPGTLAALVIASQRMEFKNDELLVRKGTPADAIFVIAEGAARVILPAMKSGGVELSAGQIFGEACLVRRGKRQADVRAKGTVVLLRIAVRDLHRIMAMHPELSGLLFNLLAGRLVANLLQTSPLFAGFSMSQRRELARMFEVRQAPAETVLQEYGKRTDGLYVALMGEFDMEEGGLVATLRPGSIFGHTSLLNRVPADRSIRASSDCLVLRMPASRFSAFAAQFAVALDYLSNLSTEPLSMWPSD